MKSLVPLSIAALTTQVPGHIWHGYSMMMGEELNKRLDRIVNWIVQRVQPQDEINGHHLPFVPPLPVSLHRPQPVQNSRLPRYLQGTATYNCGIDRKALILGIHQVVVPYPRSPPQTHTQARENAGRFQVDTLAHWNGLEMGHSMAWTSYYLLWYNNWWWIGPDTSTDRQSDCGTVVPSPRKPDSPKQPINCTNTCRGVSHGSADKKVGRSICGSTAGRENKVLVMGPYFPWGPGVHHCTVASAHCRRQA